MGDRQNLVKKVFRYFQFFPVKQTLMSVQVDLARTTGPAQTERMDTTAAAYQVFTGNSAKGKLECRV